MPARPDVATTFLRWTFARAACHRGYVLTSGLYFVIDAHLDAARLVLLGTVMAVVLLVSDIPAGALADAVSRKWPLVIGHGLMATGIIMTGLVTAFPLLLVTQMFWALGWAFCGGSDVAWLTDELNEPDRIAGVLALRARRDLAGGAVGMIMFGTLAWLTSLAAAVIASGAGMAVLGVFVAARFAEDNFVVTRHGTWRGTCAASWSILRSAVALAREDREILLVLTATLLINGAAMVTWLFPRQLVNLGYPGSPVPWYTALGIAAPILGVLALRLTGDHITEAASAGRTYAAACVAGAGGLLVLAYAPDALIGSAGVLLFSGVAANITRTVSVIWVNRRTPSDLRATVHSILSQAESLGEVLGGLALASLARTAGASGTLAVAAAVTALTAAIVAGAGLAARVRQQNASSGGA